MDGLEKLRQEINEIDKDLIILFQERMHKVKEIGNYKRKHQLPILDSSREKEVLRRNLGYLTDKRLERDGERFLIQLMEISKEVQEREQG